VLIKLPQHPFQALIVYAGVQLAVGKGAGAALAELDVALRIQLPAIPKGSIFSNLVWASGPRSRTMGRAPAFASTSAANMPAGPKPAITGRSSG
jgi:hypothetical protein